MARPIVRPLRNRLRAAVAPAGLAAAVLLAPASASARLFFSSSDAALAGATVVPLGSGIGLTQGLQMLEIVRDGVTVRFATTSQSGMLMPGVEALASFSPQGVQVTFDPPVAAAGVGYLFGECAGSAVFTGAAAMESFAFPFGASSSFVGASDVGDVATLHLNDGCFVATWPELRFVPGSGNPPPSDEADLAAEDHPLGPYLPPAALPYEVTAESAGPDTATAVEIADFLPQGFTLAGASVPVSVDTSGANHVATFAMGDVAAGASSTALFSVDPPPFGAGTFCHSTALNVAIATATSLDPMTADNISTSTAHFERSSRFGMPEICDNAHDDDCDSRPDCADSSCASHPRCQPPAIPFGGAICWGGLQALPGVGVIDSCGNIISSDGAPLPASTTRCELPTRCPGQTVSVAPQCCEPPPPGTLAWLERAQACVQQAFAGLASLPPECSVGREDVGGLSWMGMPVDPNFKEADPPVSVFGHGLTEAGRTMTYRLHYENVGTADAHDVLVLDALPPDLDETTLVVNDGGVYDPATRTLRWVDPVLPPHQPRSVSFSVAVRADAPLGTRIRNFGTIVFPDAVPPSRIDTNFVEHVIPLPGEIAVPDLRVSGCTAAGPGAWLVNLANLGTGFAYDVTATVLDAPPDVGVVAGATSFQHPDDLDPASLATVMPGTTVPGTAPIELATSIAGDPCELVSWRLAWRNAAGESFTRDQPPAVAPTPAPQPSATPEQTPTPEATPTAAPSATPPGATATPTPAPSPSAASRELCGNCVDDDGDGAVDLRDADCPSEALGDPGALHVKRGVATFAKKPDRDSVWLRATFPAPAAGGSPPFDPAASGVTVSFFAGERLIACFPTSPGKGWHTSYHERLWRFRDHRTGVLADPETSESVRVKLQGKAMQLFARFKAVELAGAFTPGEITTAVAVGDRGWVSTNPWRGRPVSTRVVTP